VILLAENVTVGSLFYLWRLSNVLVFKSLI